MHELSLAEDMLSLIEQQAKVDPFKQVTKVILEVGNLSHVEPEAMQFCFDSVMKNSIGDGAQLEICITSGQGRCPSCGTICAMTQRYDPCGNCGSFGLQVISGDAVRIKSLEVL